MINSEFLKLWKNNLGQESELFFNNILKKYSEPGRHYHTLDHILHCIELSKKVSDKLENPEEVAFALWYHDIIYHIGPPDAKQTKNDVLLSADYANDVADLSEIRLDKRVIRSLIVSTEHKDPASNNDAMYVQDIDLSILGSPKDIYESYAKNIRKEYSWAPDHEFKKHRAEVMKQFLDRDRIYLTEYFHSRLERVAIKNIENEIKKLRHV